MPFAHACVFLKHLHCFSLALQVCAALQQLAKRAPLPFASLGVAQLASFFTAALQYQFPADVGKRAAGKFTLAISCSPSQLYAVSCDYVLPCVNGHAAKHIANRVGIDGNGDGQGVLGSGRDLHHSVLMLIAAQYVFTSVMDELDMHPELKADVGIMLYSVSVSRLLLRVMKKESVALYIHMTEENVVFIPRDQASKTILKSWDCLNEVRHRTLGIETDTVAKEYPQVRDFVRELIQRVKGG